MSKIAIEAALTHIIKGHEDDKPFSSGGEKGRPSQKRVVHGIILDGKDYQTYRTLMEFWNEARNLKSSEIMTDEEFVAFMKTAAPILNKRMIDMALVSDDLKAVRQVAADLADRGYGKSASQININVSDKDIRGAWRQLEDRGVIDVSNLIEDKSDSVDVGND